MSSFMGGRYTLDSISLADLSPSQTRWLGHGRGRSPMALPLRKAAGMPDPWQRYRRYAPYCVERLSGKSLGGSDRASFGYAKRRKRCSFAPFGSLVGPRNEALAEFPDSLWKGYSRKYTVASRTGRDE